MQGREMLACLLGSLKLVVVVVVVVVFSAAGIMQQQCFATKWLYSATAITANTCNAGAADDC